MIRQRYDPDAYPLRTIVSGYFARPLEDLHRDPDPAPAHDQATRWHRDVYARLDAPFFAAYQALTWMVAASLEPQDWVVQAIPTFRFQVPGRAGTHEFHRDRDYGHPVETLNVIVPLTRMVDTTAVYAERVPYTGDYAPMPAEVGDLLLFHGALCRHGTRANLTEATRVSFDFRLLPRAALPPAGTVTANRGMPLALGAYYRTLGG